MTDIFDMNIDPDAIGDALEPILAEHAPDDAFAAIDAAARIARAEGKPLLLGRDGTDPFDAFITTATELHDLLEALSPTDWEAQTATAYGTVHGVIAHLAGIEDYCQRALDREPVADPAADFDHAACSRVVAESLRSTPNGELATIWFTSALRFVEACRADYRDETLALHQLPVGVEGALLLRTFELWAHTEDICAALGRPLPRLDGPRLALMSARLLGAIDGVTVARGAPHAVARIVLLGPGGGVGDIGLNGPGGMGPADVRIVADVVDFCRVASRRISGADLTFDAEGNRALVAPLLEATAMFAKD